MLRISGDSLRVCVMCACVWAMRFGEWLFSGPGGRQRGDGRSSETM
jgi:hypothetical protein